MSKETDMLEKRIDRLEEQMENNQKQVTADIKALGNDLKGTISQEFARCREIMPLTCPNSSRISLGQAAGLCTVIVGVFLTLAKLGLLNGLLTAAGS